MTRTSTSSAQREAGFGLVEIMVGLAIGLLATIVILQVASLSEVRKRSATGTSGAASNGAIVFNQLQRDVSQAGYGFAVPSLFHCNTVWALSSGEDIGTVVPLAPVSINPVNTAGNDILPAGDTNTDTLLVMYGNGNGQPQGDKASNVDNVFTVGVAGTYKNGDRAIGAPDACSSGSNLRIDTVTAAATDSVQVTLAHSTAASTTLFNLGSSPKILAYRIRNATLTQCDFLLNDCSLTANKDDPSVWVPIAGNIVSMRALYERSDSAGASPTHHDQTIPTDRCKVAQVSAIDLILVSRSDQYDPRVVTTYSADGSIASNAPAWSTASYVDVAPLIAAGGTLGPGTGTNEPWQHYRYRTFESVIPIRNVIWLGAVAGC